MKIIAGLALAVVGVIAALVFPLPRTDGLPADSLTLKAGAVEMEQSMTIYEARPLVIRETATGDGEAFSIERDGRIILRGKVIAKDKDLADIVANPVVEETKVPVAPQ